MGQIEFDAAEQVITVGKEKDEKVDNLIRINMKKKKKQQQVGVGDMVTSAVHDNQQEELVLLQLNTNAGLEGDENPDLEEDEHALPSSSSDQKRDEIQGDVSTKATNETSEIGSPSAGKAPTKDESEVKVSNPNPQNKHVQFGQVVVGNKEEVILEWDVERVIEEQDTHDLICPDCIACITKRVILSKRKRSLPITEIHIIREPMKFGTPTKSILKTGPSTSSSNSRGHYAADPGAPDINGRRDDVFRCFSFFIPSGLSRCFGFDNEESFLISPNQGTQSSEEVKVVGKNMANADDKNESIPFLDPAHGNDQGKKTEVEEQNVTFSPLQGAATNDR